jgi:alpha-beta hydrolase superfamily lysophospholipase
MKKGLLTLLSIIIGLYLLVVGVLYFNQEKVIFFPEKLTKSYEFKFDQKFEEFNLEASDAKILNGLLFKADNSKGLIFYLHGNAGNLSSWGEVATTYTKLNYDVFMLDYRSFGKSEGVISSQNQLFEDNQMVYNELKKKYSEADIIVLGYSIGTGFAAKLASTNQPKLLILQAPYYNLTELMKQRFSFIPTFILKYKLASNEYLKSCKMPVVIFHGNRDEIINYESSIKLKAEFKTQDTLIILDGQSHNGMSDNPDYQVAIKKILKD